MQMCKMFSVPLPRAFPEALSLSLFQPEYKVADPICTFLFSAFVLCTTLTILRDVFRILMEGIVYNSSSRDVTEHLLTSSGFV